MSLPQRLPRTLILSDTGPGSMTATGALLANLFAHWERSQLLVLDGAHPSDRTFQSLAAPMRRGAKIPGTLRKRIEAFAPELIYYRPVDEPAAYGALAEALISLLGCPYVIHLMDDWPLRLEATAPAKALVTLPRLRSLIEGAALRLAISGPMANTFSKRYGAPFSAIANGVDADSIAPYQGKDPQAPFTVLYSGALAEDMTRASVERVARAVSTLAATHAVSMTIRTMPWFLATAKQIASLPGVEAGPLLPAERYQRSLQDADCLLIAYNFDEASLRYSRLSLANKLPEYLASGTPILAHGPLLSTTIALIAQRNLGLVASDESEASLREAIEALIQDEPLRRQLAESAGAAARREFSNANVRANFETRIHGALMTSTSIAPATTVTKPERRYLSGPFDRSAGAHLDETLVVSKLVADSGPGLMIDVGAHHGSAFRPFHRAGWTVHAFEPDQNNRSYLEERYRGLERFHLDPRAVSDQDDQRLAFYTSEESTGVSGLSAFTDRHEKSGDVTTVTLASYLEHACIDEVDFLKVDTEGFDLLVLKGFPWDRCKPRVVECEFEDAKTVPLGYRYEALATFLQDQGYRVYISEWHPIIRYGIKHQWHSFYEYPGTLHDPKGWGNMLAFREPPSAEALQRAIEHQLNRDQRKPAPRKPKAEPVSSEIEITVSEEVPNVTVPLSASISSYPKMAGRFYRSRPGLIVLAFSLFGMIGGGVAAVGVGPISALAALVALGAALMVPAYLYTRIAFEREQELKQFEVEMEQRLAAAAKAVTAEAQLGTTRLTKRLVKLENAVNAQYDADASAAADGRRELERLVERLRADETTIASTERKIDLLTSELPATFETINQLRSDLLKLRAQQLEDTDRESA